MKIKKLLPLLLLFGITSCVEWFNPTIDSDGSYLSVEAIFTNRLSSSYVKLSQSVPYNESFRFIPVSQADVYVVDEEGSRFDFFEENPGFYRIVGSEAGEVGNSYQLYIETSDGNTFCSDFCLMMPSIVVDSLEVAWEKRSLYFPDNNGQLSQKEVEGVGLYANVHGTEGAFPMVRFEPIMLVQYILTELGADPDYLYCRIKRKLEQSVNITMLPQSNSYASSVFHDIGFVDKVFPITKPDTLVFQGINRRIVILRQYSLNDGSFAFYKELKSQLESEGKLFDPMPAQLKGNIICINNPQKKVLGFFEVSSFHSESFALSSEPLRRGTLAIRRVNDLDFLPDFESSWELLLDHWILF